VRFLKYIDSEMRVAKKFSLILHCSDEMIL
jgi:hypothetical protein